LYNTVEYIEGISKNFKKNSTVYPNPTNDVVNVIFNNKGSETKVVVYDILGNILISQISTTSEVQLNLSSFESGLYFIEISGVDRAPITKQITVK